MAKTRYSLAIPSLRSLRGFESLSGSPPKALSVGLFQAPEKHLMKGAFFLPCLRTRTPRASRAFGNAETTLRTPHWTRSARCAAIAIPSLRSLRGFESFARVLHPRAPMLFIIKMRRRLRVKPQSSAQYYIKARGAGMTSPPGCCGVLGRSPCRGQGAEPLGHHTRYKTSKLKQAEMI